MHEGLDEILRLRCCPRRPGTPPWSTMTLEHQQDSRQKTSMDTALTEISSRSIPGCAWLGYLVTMPVEYRKSFLQQHRLRNQHGCYS
jgi:hypothetical protein